MRIELECPYCYKIHVHQIDGLMSIPSKPVVAEKELPSDPETEDLDKFRESDEVGNDKQVP